MPKRDIRFALFESYEKKERFFTVLGLLFTRQVTLAKAGVPFQYSVEARDTLFVLLKALRMNFLSLDEYPELLEALVRANFRMSDEVYIEAVRLGRRLAKE